MRVAIFGAGASAIAAFHYLRQAGVQDIHVFEKADDLGGTWRDNRYPGVACDVPSHLYRFTFAPNSEWSHRCSPGDEIQRYMRETASRIGFTDCVAFSSEVTEARFEEGKWSIASSAGPQGEFDAVIAATGTLHHPRFPDIEGIDSFAGQACHSARWDPKIDVARERVGVIGSGSTGTQIVAALVDQAARLTLFQRTPQWIMPLPNHPIAEDKRQEFRDHPERMDAYYDYLAERFNTVFADAVSGNNPEAYDEMARACENNLHASVRDPVLRQKLTPDYKVGCKRLVVSDRFYEAIQRPNAQLVTDDIERIEPRGVRTDDGVLHECDRLIFATGFHAHSLCHPINIVGRQGRSLADQWAQGNVAYRSVAVPGFPNFFLIGGPNSPIGNFSYLMTAETQARYVATLVGALAQGKARSIEPEAGVTERYNADLRAAMEGTIWTSGCDSWYFDPHGRVASYPWSYSRFADEMREPDWYDFVLRN